MRSKRFLAVAATAVAVTLGMSACSSDSETTDTATASGEYPVTIEHALGTTTLDAKPERVATVAWANHEVPLALGVVPVGMAAANLGRRRRRRRAAVGRGQARRARRPRPPCCSTRPTASTSKPWPTRKPDVILAGYSGLTQEDYDTLSEIAPVVAYPEAAVGARRGAT